MFISKCQCSNAMTAKYVHHDAFPCKNKQFFIIVQFYYRIFTLKRDFIRLYSSVEKSTSGASAVLSVRSK